jgi:hypothetical protein
LFIGRLISLMWLEEEEKITSTPSLPIATPPSAASGSAG